MEGHHAKQHAISGPNAIYRMAQNVLICLEMRTHGDTNNNWQTLFSLGASPLTRVATGDAPQGEPALQTAE